MSLLSNSYSVINCAVRQARFYISASDSLSPDSFAEVRRTPTIVFTNGESPKY